MNTPVLFLIFNRPEKAQEVFNAIARARPKQLFVAADGPRLGHEDDMRRCRAARELIRQVDWDCEVKTLFRDENLGCGKGVALAIDWFFEQVEAGIILEDDCLPSDSFFPFCEELLERYRDDERVMMISGDNFQGGGRQGNARYSFTKIPHVWGWATWRRAWGLYDFQMKDFPDWLRTGKAETVWPDQDVRNFWLTKLIATYEGQIDTWDYQWMFAVFCRTGLSIRPPMNLISNIGFGEGATHTASENAVCANLGCKEITDWEHSLVVCEDAVSDLYEYRYVFNIKYDSILNPLLRLRKVLRKRWKTRYLLRRFLRLHFLP